MFSRHGFRFRAIVDPDEFRITVSTTLYIDPKGGKNLREYLIRKTVKCHASDKEKWNITYGINYCLYKIFKEIRGKEIEIHDRSLKSALATYNEILDGLVSKIWTSDFLPKGL